MPKVQRVTDKLISGNKKLYKRDKKTKIPNDQITYVRDSPIPSPKLRT